MLILMCSFDGRIWKAAHELSVPRMPNANVNGRIRSTPRGLTKLECKVVKPSSETMTFCCSFEKNLVSYF